MKTMRMTNLNKMAASLTLAMVCAAPVMGVAQDESRHARAVRAQRHSDHRHHTGAKIVAGSAVGGAVVGGLLGGPKGAVIGAGVGAGGGALVNHHRVKKDVHRRERDGQ